MFTLVALTSKVEGCCSQAQINVLTDKNEKKKPQHQKKTPLSPRPGGTRYRDGSLGFNSAAQRGRGLSQLGAWPSPSRPRPCGFRRGAGRGFRRLQPRWASVVAGRGFRYGRGFYRGRGFCRLQPIGGVACPTRPAPRLPSPGGGASSVGGASAGRAGSASGRRGSQCPEATGAVMAVNLSRNGTALQEAYARVVREKSPTDWWAPRRASGRAREWVRGPLRSGDWCS